MSSAGEKIISLSSGEPDFDTLTTLKEEAIKAINSGFTKYAAGRWNFGIKNSIVEKI